MLRQKWFFMVISIIFFRRHTRKISSNQPACYHERKEKAFEQIMMEPPNAFSVLCLQLSNNTNTFSKKKYFLLQLLQLYSSWRSTTIPRKTMTMTINTHTSFCTLFIFCNTQVKKLPSILARCPSPAKNEFSFALIDALWRSKWEKSEISPRYLSQSTQITMMKTSSIRLPLLYLVVMTLVILACPVILLLLAKTLLPPQGDQILELK